jgi:hypothetical protein
MFGMCKSNCKSCALIAQQTAVVHAACVPVTCMCPTPTKQPLLCRQEGTAEETFSLEQYHQLNINMLTDCATEAICRDHAMLTFMFSSVGRSDDARLMYLSDIIKPTLLRCVGKTAFILTCSLLVHSETCLSCPQAQRNAWCSPSSSVVVRPWQTARFCTGVRSGISWLRCVRMVPWAATLWCVSPSTVSSSPRQKTASGGTTPLCGRAATPCRTWTGSNMLTASRASTSWRASPSRRSPTPRGLPLPV